MDTTRYSIEPQSRRFFIKNINLLIVPNYKNKT